MTLKSEGRSPVFYSVPIKTGAASVKDLTQQHKKVREGSICQTCGAIYRHKRWRRSSVLPVSLNHGKEILCPACLKIRGGNSCGVVLLKWDQFSQHRGDLLNLINNVGKRAQGMNVLERIIRVQESSSSVEIETTTGTLAQRIGRAVEKAYHGTLSYQWSHDEKLVRVNWIGKRR